MLRKSGFSLAELVAVVAIIGILAAIGIPGYNKYKSRTYYREAKGALEVIYTAEQTYYARRFTYISSFSDLGISDFANSSSLVSYSFDSVSSSGFVARATYDQPSGGTNCWMTIDQARAINDTNWNEPC